MNVRSEAPRRSAPPGTKLWHPFADMSSIEGRELVLARGEGVWVWDTDGKRYLDASSGLWYCNIGHGRRRVAEAGFLQSQTLAAYQTFDVFATRPALELAEQICDLAGLGDHSAAFFTSGGSDSVDTAGKMARRYWRLQGEPNRRVIVARDGAYHGVHAYGTSLSGIEANASGWGVLVPEVEHVPRHDLGALERILAERRGEVAAFIGEPVQGAAGVHPPEPGYWDGVAELCRREDILLIADEVVTGFGRLGHWLGSHRYGIEPDLVVCAKGLSSGYAPIGAVVAGPRIVEALWSSGAGPFRHGYTYSGHPTACAVALENLRIVHEESLVERVAALAPFFASSIESLGSHELVREVRTAGLLAAVELHEEAVAGDGVEMVVREARERGVLTRGLVGRSLQFSPPFTIAEDEIGHVVEVVGESLDRSQARLAAPSS